jgi:DivIVA domain-containing protein
MIDLTPLDVRNKRGDFKKMMRGYDPAEVDVFLELVAERLETLVRENLQLRERTNTLQSQVETQTGREQAVQDALVTAQELRADIQAQSQREADHAMREAEGESRRMIAEAEVEARRLLAEAEAEVRARLRGIGRQLDHAQDSMTDLERRRVRFLKEFRGLLQRELDVIDVEEERAPYEERAIDLDLGPRGARTVASALLVEDAVASIDATDDGDQLSDASSVAGEVPEVDFVHAGDAPVSESAQPIDDAPQEETSPWPAEPDEVEVASPEMVDTVELDVASLSPDVEALEEEKPVDLASLQPVADVEPAAEAPTEAARSRPSAPPADVSDEPSTLELELMAGASSAAADPSAEDHHADVPDLETLLAEAGAAEIRPSESESIAPPPVPRMPRDNMILFDPNDPDRQS